MEEHAVQVMAEWVITYERWQDQGLASPGRSEVEGYWSTRESPRSLLFLKHQNSGCIAIKSWAGSLSGSFYLCKGGRSYQYDI